MAGNQPLDPKVEIIEVDQLSLEDEREFVESPLPLNVQRVYVVMGDKRAERKARYYAWRARRNMAFAKFRKMFLNIFSWSNLTKCFRRDKDDKDKKNNVAGKGVKGVKGAKPDVNAKTGFLRLAKTTNLDSVPKGSKAKGTKSAKPSVADKGIKTTKGAKVNTTDKSAKGGKSTKTAKPVIAEKGTKGTKGLKGRKGMKCDVGPTAV